MSYIATATNKHFYYLDVRIEDIDIQDIASGLANECRFNGQIDNFYFVAQQLSICQLFSCTSFYVSP